MSNKIKNDAKLKSMLDISNGKNDANNLYIDGKLKVGKQQYSKASVCDIDGKLITDAVNGKVEKQIEIEAFAYVKAMETAANKGWKEVVILSNSKDFIALKGYSKSREDDAYKYFGAAWKISKDNGIKYTFQFTDEIEVERVEYKKKESFVKAEAVVDADEGFDLDDALGNEPDGRESDQDVDEEVGSELLEEVGNDADYDAYDEFDDVAVTKKKRGIKI